MTDKKNQAMAAKLSEWHPTLKSLLDPQGYGLAIAVAITLHIIVIALFAMEWPEEKRQIAEPTPKNIQAKVIQVENKDVKKRKQTEQKRLEQKKRDARRRKDAERKKRLAVAKAKKDKVARDKVAKAKMAKEKAAKEKADRARKNQSEKERVAAEKARKLAFDQEKEDELFEQQQLLNALAVEEQQRSMDKALAEEQRAQKNAAITNTIVAQIQAKIYEAWRYPPSARPDMEVIVSISLVPTGEVIQVALEKSSGNQALDRSVLAAVRRAQPLPVPKDSRLFEQQFRSFVMSFRPEDAVW